MDMDTHLIFLGKLLKIHVLFRVVQPPSPIDSWLDRGRRREMCACVCVCVMERELSAHTHHIVADVSGRWI